MTKFNKATLFSIFFMALSSSVSAYERPVAFKCTAYDKSMNKVHINVEADTIEQAKIQVMKRKGGDWTVHHCEKN